MSQPNGGTTRASLRRAAWLLLALVAGTSGCAAYRFGNQSLYTCDVQTVHVPVFQSNSFRRNLGERLTEAVVKEIELQTPFKVVSSDRADSVLTGRIISDTKRNLVLNTDGEPRVLEADFQIQVNWTNRKGDQVSGRPIAVAVPADMFSVNVNSNFVPEGGQSISTAQQAAIKKLAVQIVEQMQTGW